jgi:tRNA dimethylallyltransferase
VSDANAFDALVICGATSTGKSQIAVLVAQTVGGEIVNADSRQVFCDMRVGTGWPAPDLMRQVPHHLYGFVDPCQRYSAGAYVDDALAALAAIRERGRVPIVVGGTGLYIEALAGTMPLDRPVADDVVRARVRREAQVHGHDFLRGWLQTIAPAASRRVTEGDRYRTLRALESALALRSMDLASTGHRERPRLTLRIAIVALERELLADRIAARVRAMWVAGLAEEALAVTRRCDDAPALTGLGYAEALAWLRGQATEEEAIRNTIARTIRYAKRQQTWFRRMRAAIVVDAGDARAAAAAIALQARESASPA